MRLFPDFCAHTPAEDGQEELSGIQSIEQLINGDERVRQRAVDFLWTYLNAVRRDEHAQSQREVSEVHCASSLASPSAAGNRLRAAEAVRVPVP